MTAKSRNFNEFYALYYRKSFLFAKSYIHDDLAAEDIASDSLIKLWEKMRSEEVRSMEAFLVTVLKNKSLDYLKHEAVKQEAYSSINRLQQRELDIRISTLRACDPEEIFSSEINQLMRDVLDSLSEQTKKVFQLSRFENKSNKEIALEMNITTKGVEYHISKAIKIFRMQLKDYLYIMTFFQL
ncbi:MAG: RNA polymerase sigma-70 factor [Dysgonamonadaceae bacterium]|jgi:RNA polymerase sigma-70 factor (ECF subfamily)|nr:RNA polymerase sigma-70 factor [Dysgonamonadaceae bacterium]